MAHDMPHKVPCKRSSKGGGSGKQVRSQGRVRTCGQMPLLGIRVGQPKQNKGLELKELFIYFLFIF